MVIETTSAAQYSFVTLPAALLEMQPTGINESGGVVGNYKTSYNPFSQTTNGFLYQDGAYTTVDNPYAVHTIFGGSGDSGNVATIWQDIIDGKWKGAIYVEGAFVPTLLPAGVSDVMPSDVHNVGQHAGYFSFQSQSTRHGYISDSITGEFTLVDYPGAVQTNVYGLNDVGRSCGIHIYPDPVLGLDIRGFQYDLATGVFTDLTMPTNMSPSWIWPLAINNKGVVVGVLEDPFGVEPDAGFIWDASGFRKFEHPVGELGTRLTGVNDHGQLCGTFQGTTSRGAIVASPVL